MTKKSPHYIYLAIAAGFAMFSMFFGSGNLVFPIMVGHEAGTHYLAANLGLMLTSVLVPFLGLYTILLFKGNYENFFAQMGKYTAFWLPLLIIAIIGPFGVIPRTITVAHGSFLTLLPDTPLWLFSIIMAGVTFALILDTRKIIVFLGIVLTPLLLLSLAAIVGFAIFAQINIEHINTTANQAFTSGLVQGYFTMDLLAAFFFANIIVRHIEDTIHTNIDCEIQRRQTIFISMLIAAGLLIVIYCGFIFLGSKYAAYINLDYAEQAIAIIAQQALGQYAGIVVTTAVILATLTTAIALTVVSERFLRIRVMRNKIGRLLSITIILVISALFSNIAFSGIAAFLAPILEVLYPALIILTIMTILHKRFDVRFIKWPVYLALLLGLAVKLF